MSDEIPHDAEAGGLHDTLHCRSDIPEMISHRCSLDTCSECSPGCLKKPRRLFTHLSHSDSRCRIRVVALILDTHVYRHEIPFDERPLSRRNPMHDLVVDRAADTRRKIVQALERRNGALVAADEIFGNR